MVPEQAKLLRSAARISPSLQEGRALHLLHPDKDHGKLVRPGWREDTQTWPGTKNYHWIYMETES
jgi:hypothetical protein